MVSKPDDRVPLLVGVSDFMDCPGLFAYGIFGLGRDLYANQLTVPKLLGSNLSILHELEEGKIHYGVIAISGTHIGHGVDDEVVHFWIDAERSSRVIGEQNVDLGNKRYIRYFLLAGKDQQPEKVHSPRFLAARNLKVFVLQVKSTYGALQVPFSIPKRFKTSIAKFAVVNSRSAHHEVLYLELARYSAEEKWMDGLLEDFSLLATPVRHVGTLHVHKSIVSV